MYNKVIALPKIEKAVIPIIYNIHATIPYNLILFFNIDNLLKVKPIHRNKRFTRALCQ